EPREGASRLASIPRAEFSEIVLHYDDVKADEEKVAILVCAWYLRSLSDKELVGRIKPLISERYLGDAIMVMPLREILEHLGEKPAEEPRKGKPH
ncbi:MAG TPA: hypothetical protein VKI40_02215, partial [Terriglobales bacterium]|nr:hypothetical protein [Terriglobales bacterium]